MLSLRIITAVFGIPFLYYIFFLAPSWAVFLFALVCCAFSLFEIVNLIVEAFKVTTTYSIKKKSFTAIFPIVFGVVFFGLSELALPQHLSALIVAGIFFIGLIGAFLQETISEFVFAFVLHIFIFCYGCLPWVSLWNLYKLTYDPYYISYLLCIIMASDSGAYFAGRFFGKRKLAPLISPKKTWEGVLGGIICSMIAVGILNQFLFPQRQLFVGSRILLVIVISFVGVLGDLLESAFKRLAQVKDSGNVFPGHGGFLDRTDSLIVATPVFFLCVLFFS